MKKKKTIAATSAVRAQRKSAAVRPMPTARVRASQGARARQGTGASHPSQGSQGSQASQAFEVRLAVVENQLNNNVATKADLAELDRKNEERLGKLDKKIETENEKIHGNIKELRGEMKTENEKTRSEIKDLKIFFFKIILSGITGSTGLIIAAIYIYINWPA